MLVTVFGRRGTGKTTLIRKLVPQFKKPVVIIDILGNFDSGENSYDDLTDALCALKDYYEQETKKYGNSESNTVSKTNGNAESSGIIIVQGSDPSRAVDYLSAALWAGGGGTLVLDEVDSIRIADAPCFDEAIRYGRNKGIDIVTGCRRPAEVSKNITAGADLAYCLSTHEPRDIEYYCDFLGDEYANRLPHLPQYHGIWKDFKNQRIGTFKTDSEGNVILLTQTSLIKENEKCAKESEEPSSDLNASPKSTIIETSIPKKSKKQGKPDKVKSTSTVKDLSVSTENS